MCPPGAGEPAFVAIVSGTGFKRPQFCIWSNQSGKKSGQVRTTNTTERMGFGDQLDGKRVDIKDDLQILVILLWRW